MDGSILLHTRTVADRLAHELRDNPEAEVEIWATTAQQREAMVVMLYDGAAIERRLPKRSGEAEILPVVRKTIGSIWAQERSHTTLVEGLRIVDEARLTSARSLLGAIEGAITHSATANGWTRAIATFLIGLGRTVKLAPEFTDAFSALTPRQFFRLSHELETTAKEGYARVLQLLSLLPAPLDTPDMPNAPAVDSTLKFGLTAPYEFAKTLAEECFHAAVFEQLEAWLETDGQAFTSVPAQEAVVRLRELAIEHLSFGSRSLGPAALKALERPWSKSVDHVALVSDGGLGALFEEYGVALPSVAP